MKGNGVLGASFKGCSSCWEVHMKFKRLLGTVGLGAALLVLGSGMANAQWWGGDCNARIARERAELYNAERFYGPYSWQADHERAELNRLYSECGYGGYYVQPRPGFYFNGNFFVGGRHHDRDDRRFHRDFDREHHDRDHDRH